MFSFRNAINPSVDKLLIKLYQVDKPNILAKIFAKIAINNIINPNPNDLIIISIIIIKDNLNK